MDSKEEWYDFDMKCPYSFFPTIIIPVLYSNSLNETEFLNDVSILFPTKNISGKKHNLFYRIFLHSFI